MSFIGVLDIFGFEVFTKNSFEQFCINFANEKLQQLFCNHVFKLELELYKAEMIDHSHITFTDNQMIIDLIEKRPHGIFSLLDEACLFPRSTDESFLNKCNSTHGKAGSKHTDQYKKTKFGAAFTICHSAGEVTYDVEDFLNKNRDRLADNAGALMAKSSLKLLASLFDNGSTEVKGGSMIGANAFLGSKFKDDMKKLMIALNSTTPQFVRCIKPNSLKKAQYVEPDLVLHQLRYLGILDSIRIRHSGFSYRVTYATFYDRFIMVVPGGTALDGKLLPLRPRQSDDLKALCCALVDVLWHLGEYAGKFQRNAVVQFGLTKIFMRRKLIQSLDSLRDERLQAMDASATKVQSAYRMHTCRRGLRNLYKCMPRAQAAWRARFYRKAWKDKVKAKEVLGRCLVAWVHRMRFIKKRGATRLVQKYYRKNKQRIVWFRMRQAMTTLHLLSRGYMLRQHVLGMIKAVNVLQRTARKFIANRRSYWNTVRSALIIQGIVRGFLHRQQRPDIQNTLEERREDRYRDRCARLIQSTWTTFKVRDRFLDLRKSASIIARYNHAWSLRFRFIRTMRSTRILQRVTRGFLSRCVVDKMKTVNAVADELWRIKTLRSREGLQLEKMHSDLPLEVQKHVHTVYPDVRKKQRAASALKKRGFLARGVLDCDIVVNSFDIYPDGWSFAASQLRDALANRGTEIHDIGVGVAHTVCVDGQGSVYTWGWGERGQLGRGRFCPDTNPQIVEYFEELKQHEENDSQRTKRCFRSPSLKGRVVNVAVGDEHSVVLTSGGRVYSWGAGGRGQLGCGDKLNHALPCSVHVGDRSTPVTKIACGAFHTLALKQTGALYSWGSGKQLGLGVFSGNGDRSKPQLVLGMRKFRVRAIGCGWGHSIVSTYDGTLYSWGSNKDGQLGTNDTKPRLVPTRINIPDVQIVQFSCGPRHSAALEKTGNVYIWGSNRCGQLGLGDSKIEVRLC